MVQTVLSVLRRTWVNGNGVSGLNGTAKATGQTAATLHKYGAERSALKLIITPQSPT